MMRVYFIIICSSLLCNFEVGNGEKTGGKTYHKSPPPAAAPPDTDIPPKGEVILEGQLLPHSETIISVPGKTNSPKEVVKKGSKTVPRKGVIDKSVEKIDTNNNKTVAVSLEIVNNQKNNTLPSVKKTSVDVTKLSTSTEKWHLAPVSEVTPKEVQAQVKKIGRKPKPEITVSDGKEPDGPIPASPTRTSSLSMPSKIDYVVPVAITLTALPLLGAAFLVLYRRGRDYWDKRHYRRMDFLIDGMYNE